MSFRELHCGRTGRCGRRVRRATALVAGGAIAIGLVLAAPRAADGQTQPDATSQPSANDMLLARERFARGVALFEHRDFDAALAEFLRAHELSRRATVLYNIGATYHQLHRYTEATEALERFLETARDAPPDLRVAAERALREIATLIATIRVTVEPEQASLTMDGSPIRANEDVRVSPGRHRIEAQLDGYRIARDDVVIASRERREVRLTLERSRLPDGGAFGRTPPPQPSETRLTVLGAPPNALVQIADRRYSAAAPIDVPAGSHTVTVSAPDSLSWSGTVLIPTGVTRALRVNLAGARSQAIAPAVFWSVAISSGAIGVAAIGFGIAAIGTNVAFRSPQTSELDAIELASRGRAFALTADILGITAIAGTVAAVSLLARTEFAPRRSSAVIIAGGPLAPTGGPGASLSAGLRF